MKKLNKIRLQNAVVLENSEMKAIYGGSGGDGGSGSNGGSGSDGGSGSNSGSGVCAFKDGEHVFAGCTSDADCISWYGEGWCQ